MLTVGQLINRLQKNDPNTEITLEDLRQVFLMQCMRQWIETKNIEIQRQNESLNKLQRDSLEVSRRLSEIEAYQKEENKTRIEERETNGLTVATLKEVLSEYPDDDLFKVVLLFHNAEIHTVIRADSFEPGNENETWATIDMRDMKIVKA